MSALPVELIKGHDNSPDDFDKICYIQIPFWLAKKIQGRWKKEEQEHLLFQVVEETEKAYRIIFCKDSSLSSDFIRITWYLEWVSKSIVQLIRTDIEQYEKELQEYWSKKYETLH